MKFLKNWSILLLMAALQGCYYGINESTTEICSLNTDCMKNGTWERIKAEHSIEGVRDSVFLVGLHQIQSMPFPTEVYYFHEGPRELIAIQDDHYVIWYVFNLENGALVFDGTSSVLNAKGRIEYGKGFSA